MIKPPRFGTCTQQRANQCDRKCDSDLKILECGIGITTILVSKPHEDKLGNTSLAAIVNARQRFICFFEKTVRRLRTFDMRTIGRCSDQSHAVFDGSIMRSHFCDMPGRTANVRYWGEIGLNADIGLRAVFEPQPDIGRPRWHKSPCERASWNFEPLQRRPRPTRWMGQT
jgi:hypothetical protein